MMSLCDQCGRSSDVPTGVLAFHVIRLTEEGPLILNFCGALCLAKWAGSETDRVVFGEPS